MKRAIGVACVALGLAMSCAPMAFAQKASEQASTRSVEGLVTDASKQAVSGAVVLLKDTKTLQIRSFITDKDGKYHFTGLSTNVDYEIHAQREGDSSPTKRLDVFNTRQVATINLQLKKK